MKLRDLRVGDVVKVTRGNALKRPLWALVTEASEEPAIRMVQVPEESQEYLLANWYLNQGEPPWTSFLDSADEFSVVPPDEIPDEFWAALALLELTGQASTIP